MASLMNGLSAMGAGVAAYAGTAGLEQQRADLAQQQTILADQLATVRESGGRVQAGQIAATAADKLEGFTAGQNTLNRQAEAAKTAVQAQTSRDVASITANAPSDTIKLFKYLKINPAGDPVSGTGSSAPAGAGATGDSSAATPPAGSSTPAGSSAPAATPAASPAGSTGPSEEVRDVLYKKALGFPLPGSEEAIRSALAADVRSDPKFKYASPGKVAAEVESRLKVAGGTMLRPETIETNAQAIAAGQQPMPEDKAIGSADIRARVFQIKPDYQASDYTTMHGSMGNRNEVYFKRVTTAANQVAQAAENIMELPAATSSGIFAGRGQAPGLMNALKETLTNKLTSQDVQSYMSMVPGVSRGLATIETMGLAPPGSFATSMDALTLKEGDTEETRLRKMAEVRQIVEKGMETNLLDPKIPDVQKGQIRAIIAQIQQAVPFTQHDITALKQSKDSGRTLADIVTSRGLGGARPATPASAGQNAPALADPLGIRQ